MSSLNIKSVARLSGISTYTLRAWELRYSVVVPARSGNGRRLYTMEDVNKLKLLAQLVNQGHSIGTLAKMSLGQLHELSTQAKLIFVSDSPHKAKSIDGSGSMDPLVIGILEALGEYDLEKVEQILIKCKLERPIQDFVFTIISPLLFSVGEAVYLGSLDISHEHILTALLRNLLGELLMQVQKASPWKESKNIKKQPKFIFATPEGDLHEFGILLSALLVGSAGFAFRYLGPSIPAISLVRAAVVAQADTIVLGSALGSVKNQKHPLKEYVRDVFKGLKNHSALTTRVCIGGECSFKDDLESFKGRLYLAKSLRDFESFFLAK